MRHHQSPPHIHLHLRLFLILSSSGRALMAFSGMRPSYARRSPPTSTTPSLYGRKHHPLGRATHGHHHHLSTRCHLSGETMLSSPSSFLLSLAPKPCAPPPAHHARGLHGLVTISVELHQRTTATPTIPRSRQPPPQLPPSRMCVVKHPVCESSAISLLIFPSLSLLIYVGVIGICMCKYKCMWVCRCA